MAFTPKDWKDVPDTSTPISAAALEDLEARVATYADSAASAASGGITAAVSEAGSGAANLAAINAAIDEAVAFGRGAVHIPAGIYNFDCPISRAVDNLTIFGDGPGVTVLKMTRTNTDPVKEGIRLVGSNLTVRDLELREGNPVATQDDHVLHPGLVGIRIGGMPQVGGNVIGTNVSVRNCLMTNIIGQAIALYYASQAEAVGNFIIACGEGIAAESCIRDVLIDGNTVNLSADDLIIVKASDDNGGVQTLNAVVTNNHVAGGSAKGITILGTKHAVVDSNVIDSVNQFGISVFDDQGFGNLLPPERVVVSNNVVMGAGAWYGANSAIYKYDAPNVAAAGLHAGGAPHTQFIGNKVYDSQGHGIQADGGCPDLSIEHNEILGASRNGISVGNPDGASYTTFLDTRIHGNLIRNVVGGILCGESTNLQVTNNNIRSYKSGASGSRRGIQIGHCDRFDVWGNHVTNDDGGAELYLEYNSCTNGLQTNNRFGTYGETLVLQISVKDYGALGDGATDDTAAIQAAIDAAAASSVRPTIAFPPGNYLCGDLDVIAAEGIKLVGLGGGKSNVTAASPDSLPQITHTGAGVLFDIGTFDSTPGYYWEGNWQGFHIEKLRLYNNAGQTQGSRTRTAIRDNGCGDVTIRDCQFQNFKYGFAAPYGSDFTTIERSFFGTCDVGVYLGPGSEQVDIRTNEFYFCMEGFVADSAPQGRMESCWFIDSRTVDIQFERLTTTRFGLTGTAPNDSDLSWVVASTWHESGANGDNVKASNGHIRTTTNDAGNPTFPRNLRVTDPFIVAGGSGGSNRSFWECDSGKFLRLENLLVRGDQIAYAMNSGTNVTLIIQKGLRTSDTFTTVIPFRNEDNNCCYLVEGQDVPGMPDVASTATVTLPANADKVKITGTADITSITAGYNSRQVTLVFTGTASNTGLTDGSNLALAGNFVYTPNDTITLVTDAFNWYEVARSVN